MTINFDSDDININLDKNELSDIEVTLKEKYSANIGWKEVERVNEIVDKIEEHANYIRKNFQLVLICGVGGSYLGARAVIQALQGEYRNLSEKPMILFLGNNLSAPRVEDKLKLMDSLSTCVIAISKSGNTTETNLALHLIVNKLKKQYENIKDRVYIITNESSGKLRELCNANDYTSFVVDEDVGGRYSVLTSVGMFPAAVAGINIKKIIKGAIDYKNFIENCSIEENECYKYALARRELRKKGKTIELLSAYNPNLEFFFKWYVQLFGESEGKCEEAIFPSYLIYTQDLHSMGQYIQEGPRITFETVIGFNVESVDFFVDLEDVDSRYKGLNSYSVNKLNKAVERATKLAHRENGVRTLSMKLEKLDEYNLGALLYFFMYSCAISSIMLGVNPFNQPGVEKYKNLFKELIK